MTIEHKNISNANLHEPKGVSAATVNEVYVANGSGSGTWKKPVVSDLNTTGGTDGEIFVANGTGGGDWKSHGDNVYGQMEIVGNTSGLATTAASDSTLNTDSDYSKITGIWTAPTGVTNSGVSFSVDELQVPVSGVYRVEFWASFKSPNSSTSSIKFAINDTTPYSNLKMKRTSTSATDYGVASSHTFIHLSANDTISLYYANTTTNATGLVIEDAVLILQLMSED